MLSSLFLVLAIFAAVFCSAQAQYNATSFDMNQATTSVWLSAAAYCGKENYKSHTFKGPTAGFVVTYVISEKSSDTQGYVGFLPSDKSIYVVYRGSQDIRNWITNLDAFKVDYTSYPECNCQVHKGFYNAEQAVFSGVLTEVKSLMKAHSGYAVKVTGHSLGAALAQLTGMDLIKNGISASVYNYGQPRVGDKSYAPFSTNKMSQWRVTHNKDVVPHVPYTTKMEFYHACTEEFEDVNGNTKTCNSSCEDPSCADQYAFKDCNVDDHLIYLGLDMNCDAVSR